jgi:hypothetical protein
MKLVHGKNVLLVPVADVASIAAKKNRELE